MKISPVLQKGLVAFFILSGFVLPCSSSASTPQQTIAVLPFAINADKDMDYIKSGISTMLYSRLTWPDKVTVVPPKQMATLKAGLNDLPENELVRQTAKKTGSRYVIFGTITSLSGAFSIDAKVFDTLKKQYISFYEQSQNANDLIKQIDRIAAAINYKVFQRSTVTWEQMEQKKQKQLNDQKHQNPENLMQVPADWKSEKKIGWKVWKYLF